MLFPKIFLSEESSYHSVNIKINCNRNLNIFNVAVKAVDYKYELRILDGRYNCSQLSRLNWRLASYFCFINCGGYICRAVFIIRYESSKTLYHLLFTILLRKYLFITLIYNMSDCYNKHFVKVISKLSSKIYNLYNLFYILVFNSFYIA